MSSLAENIVALYSAPWQLAKLVRDAPDTTLAVQRVMSTRLPTLVSAVCSPDTADHRELGLMVSEKIRALLISGHSLRSTSEKVGRAAAANTELFVSLAIGAPRPFDDLAGLVADNFAAAAALSGLPIALAAPFQEGLRSNDARLHAGGSG